MIFAFLTTDGLDSFVLIMFYSWNGRSTRKLAHADPEADGNAGRYGRQAAPYGAVAWPG
jgi:hypothetical protein